MKFKLAVVLNLAVLLFSGMSMAQADNNVLEGYHGASWGTSLKEFKSSQNSFASSSVERTEARALDYLMMNFHEVDMDDVCRPAKFVVQKIGGDHVDYVFYDGEYQLAAVPIAAGNVGAMKKAVEAKYAKKDSKTYLAYWEFKGGDYGWLMMEFHYQQYAKTPGTRVYLVTTSSYYEDQGTVDQQGDGGVAVHGGGPKTDAGAFLIYVSDNYFKNTDNAWVDYQSNLKNKPAMEKEAQENRKQQDLNSIE
jgi:hypothetical protein